MFHTVRLLVIIMSIGAFSNSAYSLNYSEDYYLLTTSLKKGEGVLSLLKRYHLNNSCNEKAFYEINKIKDKHSLQLDKKYKLPVKIYTYNGRSIRSTINNTDWDIAVAIKEFNEEIRKRGIRKTHYADSKILWVPYHLINCPIENKKSLPIVSKPSNAKAAPTKTTSGRKITDKLYGSKYSEVEVVDQSLKDQVFYIVSGHGGPDPGAMCTDHATDLCEDEYAYDVALRLARNLTQHGAQVEMIIQDKNDGIRDDHFLICDKDETCGPSGKIPLNQRRRLLQRASRINTLYKKYKARGFKTHKAIVIHVDANRKTHRQDVFFYHHKSSKTGKRIANSIHKTFQSKYQKYQKGRGYSGSVTSRGLYMINYTNPPLVYVELGNIKNHKDQKRLLLNTNRQALANWLFEGLIAN